ncbi:hypothetical protein GW7_16682 [Heterocephalus glaber]|uniref:Uncharacterized protein n=1 Tax=Heterocephalus glaber TaxID=10181 RepID=G5C7B3_HETGA|nr:hypothetical protein GW7_16682 [Heterocephalus glaber]
MRGPGQDSQERLRGASDPDRDQTTIPPPRLALQDMFVGHPALLLGHTMPPGGARIWHSWARGLAFSSQVAGP